ncbi:Trimeric GatFAB AmidoTransferase(AdT) complex subunit [Tilletia horrida]|nr:Trimeric GatFAB AmidoTransferase(AdT) complex subunit [Tilletia horrida]
MSRTRASTLHRLSRRFSSSFSSNEASSADAYNAIVTRPSHAADIQSTGNGPLNGVAVSIKHNFLTADMPSTASSRMLAYNFQPHFDATAVRLLRRAGANIVGKTNCDEFGMGSANLNSIYGPVLNPAGGSSSTSTMKRVAGGSSGGAAASVRSGSSDLALASDTGGSIRLPASYCGVWGLKPSYGRISRWGLISYADSLDTVGLVARDLALIENGFQVLDLVDERDPSTIGRTYRQRASRLISERLASIGTPDNPLAGLIVGVPLEYFPEELSPEAIERVRCVLKRLRDAGATIRSVSLPNTRRALGAYYVVASAEAASNLARYDGIRYGYQERSDELDIANGEHLYAATRTNGFGEEVRKRILTGTYALSADAFDNYFLKAQKFRRLVQADFDRGFRIPNVLRTFEEQDSIGVENVKGVDILIHASAVGIAPTMPASSDGLQSSIVHKDGSIDATSYVQDVLTVPASLAGLPALNMPVELELKACSDEATRLPIGVSAVAQWGCESILWKVARHAAADVSTT